MLSNEPKLDDFPSNEIRRYFRIFKTILEIMDARGYVVLDDAKSITPAEFTEMHKRDELSHKKELFPPLDFDENDEYDPSIAVYYNFAGEEITEEYIKTAIQSAPKIKHFFIVAPVIEKPKGTTTLIHKKVQNFINDLAKRDKDEKEGMRIEIFKQDDLYFNVLKHELVPVHKVLSENEKTDLLAK